MKPNIFRFLLLLTALLASPSFAAPWHKNCKIWHDEDNSIILSEFEQLAIEKFIEHTNHKVRLAEICTVEDDEKEMFFAIEKNVKTPPAPGSNTFVIIKKNANRSIEVFDGK